MNFRTTVLPEGLTVVTEQMPGVRSVSIGFWVGAGSVDEDPSQSGASHFLEHLLFKGTEELTAREIAEQIDAVGGDMNAFTTKEYTTFYVRLLGENASMGVDVLSDIMWSPAFRPDEIDSERQVILEEILMHADEPADLVHDVLAAALFPGHPLGRQVLGEADTISRMTRDRIARFHDEHYRPGNIVVAAAGKLDHDEIVERLASRLGGRSGGSAPQRSTPAGQRSLLEVHRRTTEQAHLAVAVPAPHRDDEERHAVSIVEHVLGGGMSSRLFQSIREERGLAYSVYAYRLGFQGAGALAVYAGTSPEKAAEVRDLILEEMQRMAEDGMTQQELDNARSHIRGSMALGLEDSGARMSRIGHSQLVHGKVLRVEDVEGRLNELTLDHVNEVGRRWLSYDPTIACVGPFDAGDLAAA
ncbi:MAG TPA: pitrilysin family protein [Acidimicrobiales bacterium]|nr:pitrilysin family protein [Acidimicrobiales bacterium]